MFSCLNWCFNYMKILPLLLTKRPHMSENRILPLIVLLIGFVLPYTVGAQVPVEVSGEKVIYGGKVFHMHNVQKGQTLYSISRAYKVSIDAITRENVIPASGIQEGQMLRIPSVSDNSAVVSQPRPAAQPAQPAQRSVAEASRAPAASPAVDAATGIRLARERIMYNGKPYYMHEVQKGQTLYSIARAYKVTILDIDRENAISAGGLRAGQILRIPAVSSLVVQEEVVPQDVAVQERSAVPATQSGAAVAAGPKPSDRGTPEVQATAAGVKSQTDPTLPTKEAAPADAPARQADATNQAPAPVRESAAKPAPPAKKKIHKVQKGESLADIAKKYDLTLQELKQANKGVIFAMPDMRLVIPVKGDQDPDNQ
jgi:LysM repeat protein